MPADSSDIPGYAFGSKALAVSPVTFDQLAALQQSVGWTPDDPRQLAMAGEVLADQVWQVVAHWRSQIIASVPHLARHSRSATGEPLPAYLAASNRRFEQWILDTCRRPYDQDWLNYQFEIARRHTTLQKNLTDGVQSTPFVPFRDILAFTAVMNQTIKPYLAAKGHTAEQVERMHQAWCKSLALQIAIWGRLYTDPNLSPPQW